MSAPTVEHGRTGGCRYVPRGWSAGVARTRRHVADPHAHSAAPPAKGLRDKVLHVDTVFSLGFWKPFPKFRFGSSDKAFATPGAGGSFGMADPDTGIGFGYVTNRLGFHVWRDPSELALRHTLFHDVLGCPAADMTQRNHA
jgi:CubicO group peptidase (beta-lactamase class C family)